MLVAANIKLCDFSYCFTWADYWHSFSVNS